MEEIVILISDVKPIGKVGKNMLENTNIDMLIEKIIEKPLQKACKHCKEKNIETVMSSANKNNIVEKVITKKDIIIKSKQTKMQTFLSLGKGFVWLMINYETLSDENKKILFDLEDVLQEDTICFVKSNYVEIINPVRKFFKLKQHVEIFNDTYADVFKQRQILLMYNNKYPRRSVFVRMSVNKNTTVEDVEVYFEKILSQLKHQ